MVEDRDPGELVYTRFGSEGSSRRSSSKPFPWTPLIVGSPKVGVVLATLGAAFDTVWERLAAVLALGAEGCAIEPGAWNRASAPITEADTSSAEARLNMLTPLTL